MLLSIIIRTWNRLEYTIKTIVSIDEKCGLDKDDFEIICVDQNSTDGTRKWFNFNYNEKYYPIVPLLLSENVGDALGIKAGINVAKGDFIAQHDNDLEIITSGYYKKLIQTHKYLEKKGYDVCAVSGSHKQGIDVDAAPHHFARLRYSDNYLNEKNKHSGYIVSWVHGSFIFRKKLIEELNFDKRGCNSWCSTWWDKGYVSFNCRNINFWHIDSGETGAHVKKQAEKFPSYKYVKKNYGKFI